MIHDFRFCRLAKAII